MCTVSVGSAGTCCFSDVLVFLNFWHFSLKLKQTGSLGATESEVWIGNFNVKAWKTTAHKLYKIWPLLKFCKISGKRAHPRENCLNLTAESVENRVFTNIHSNSSTSTNKVQNNISKLHEHIWLSGLEMIQTLEFFVMNFITVRSANIALNV